MLANRTLSYDFRRLFVASGARLQGFAPLGGPAAVAWE